MEKETVVWKGNYKENCVTFDAVMLLSLYLPFILSLNELNFFLFIILTLIFQLNKILSKSNNIASNYHSRITKKEYN